MHIHIQWEGPFTIEEAATLKNENTDYGIYQIYGTHPLYGLDALVYIGRADKQTFGERLSQHNDWLIYDSDSDNVKVYVGRLHTYDKTPRDGEWSKEIELVEKLLIYAHAPALNKIGINLTPEKNSFEFHVLNWGQYKRLLPEVSGARYSYLYHSNENYQPYGHDR